MSPLAASVLSRAGEQLGDFLPRLGGALILLIVGLLAARIIGGLVRKSLHAAHADDLAERWGVSPVLERAGLGASLSTLLGRTVRLGLAVVVILATVSLLGLQFLDQALNQTILFLPNVLLAGALLLAGIVLGGMARDHTARLARQMDFSPAAGRAAEIAVVGIFAVTAAAQIGVSTSLLILLAAVLLVTSTLTLTLAFGLGGRELARELTAGRYLRGAYTVGQIISFDEIRGEIIAFDTAATTIHDQDGHTVRIPHYRLLNATVTVHPAGPASSGQS